MSSSVRAARDVLQDHVDLRSGHPGEPSEDLLDRGSALEILEKRAYGYARAAKYPGAAQLSGIPLYRRTGRPIKHCLILVSALSG